MSPRLDRIVDWKTFERLCADLLEADQMVVTKEPSVDTSGEDLHATEEYRSHDGSRAMKLEWRVQCKHYAISGKKLDRTEMETILASFEAIRGRDDGLLLLISSDYTEPARRVWDKYQANHPLARIQVWNQRQILAKLDRYGHVARRYGLLALESRDILQPFRELNDIGPADVLLVSDQSGLAQDLAEGFNEAGFNVFYLPFWNYQSEEKFGILLDALHDREWRLVALFLGDSFQNPLPPPLMKIVRVVNERGGAILLFPFLAWTLARGGCLDLSSVCPVALVDPRRIMDSERHRQMVIGTYRAGDYTHMLDLDRFAEDQYTELNPRGVSATFAAGVDDVVGFSHSFEYLQPREGSEVAWADAGGNPFIVTWRRGKGKVCYINTCCHGCMSLTRVQSPVRSAGAMARILANAIRWLMQPF